jgi:hypothetical protein
VEKARGLWLFQFLLEYNEPSSTLRVWVLHQRKALAKILHLLLNRFHFFVLGGQPIIAAQEWSRATMLENMQASVKDVGRQGHSGLLQSLDEEMMTLTRFCRAFTDKS